MRTRILSGILAVAFAAVLFVAAGNTAHANNYKGHGYYGGHGTVHCVKYGETLYGIAGMYGTSAWAIANANGLVNPNYIRAGQCLTIPKGHGGYYHGGYAKPKPAPYYGGYGHNANYNYHHGKYNNYHGGYHGKKGSYHCMKYGETVSGVAAMYGTTTWAIAKANGLKHPNYVKAGTCLVIPTY